MFCISLTFRDADVALREQFSESPKMPDCLSESVFLSTCNRVEVYGVGDLYETIEALFAGCKSRLALYEGERATRHLFKVASGLDSMVLGEDEILGQLRNAFLDAQEAGQTGYELNTVFRGAITAAKKVKTETKLSKTSVSVATLAASACSRFAENLPSSCKVLLIGASGEIGSKLAKDLLSIGRFEVTATVRRHQVQLPVSIVAYENRYETLADADIVISATRCPFFTITAEAVGKLPEKERLYIDLSVPRDIDPALTPVITVDDLQDLARRNNEIKLGEVPLAEAILEEELETLRKDLTFHRLLPLLEDPPEGLDETQWKRLFYRMRETATAEQLEVITETLLQMEDPHEFIPSV